MKRIASVLAVSLAVGPAHAWEAATTHAGLAEQAAMSSRLHKRLVSLGFTGGLFEPLTIPPADAPALMQSLRLLSPTHGAVPDSRGRQSALAWIAAGASLADLPVQHGANHFFDPASGRGWVLPDRGVLGGLSDRVREAVGRAALPERGVPAVAWVTAKDNPFNLANFLDQYGKAVSAATPGERSRHMAAALVASGAILHVLADVGSPSRVRGDEAAHFEPLGGGPDDLGSRFERIAALAFGRLGVPGPARVITRTHLHDFFSAQDGSGLADVVARSYFSANTLPRPVRVGAETRPELVRPQPALPTRLNLMAASREEGTTLRTSAGTCLARYRVVSGTLAFHLDDDCMLEQVTAVLPEVSAYTTGLLEFLLRGELVIAVGPQLVVSGTGLGAGTLDVLVEDELGVRTSLGSVQVAAGKAELARLARPPAGVRVVAVFRGADAAGEPVVAVGAMPLPAR
jgi:hypothetical protein